MRISKLSETIIVIALVLIAGFSVVSYIYYLSFHENTLRRLHHEAELEIATIHSELSSLFIQEVTVSSSMANDNFLIQYLSDEHSYESDKFEDIIKKYLQNSMKTYHFDGAFLSLTKNNKLYSQNGFERILTNDVASEWYNAAVSNKKPYDINIDTDKFKNNDTSIFVNCKIYGLDNKLLGIIGVCLHIDKIIKAIRSYEKKSGIRIYLVNENGNIEISSTRQGCEDVDWLNLPGNNIFSEKLLARNSNIENILAFSDENTDAKTYVFGKYIPVLSWFLIVERPTKKFYDAIWYNAFNIIGIVVIIIIVVIFVTSSLVKSYDREIIKLSDERRSNIEKMRDAIVVTLAGLVEGRDQNTGEHIRKTAEYVHIIMKQLQRTRVFGNKITDEYIEDVVRSAPLHDIGKINIPDAILNKPGKLTDEEFSIMKTHASVGGKIIDHIINLLPHSSYLKEAKDLATYHHERWIGGGYPSGIAGEDIPLSARIMAVADVFDALVSDRSYKKGFPLEKAFAIIQEERGTRFDPRIVDAFFAARDEIIKVENSFPQHSKGEFWTECADVNAKIR
ncbi:MAG: HD domain-containing protein [Desulfovibrio sp.]|nr:HD domain-containing protein [Desulfovibrio sp.]